MADWSQLPKELLDVISTRLDSSTDAIRLRAVCSAWRAAVTVSSASDQNLPFRYLTNEGFAIFDGFFLSKRTIFLLSRPTNPIYDSHPKPDADSWLIKTEKQGQSELCRLFNPLSQAEMRPSSAGLRRTIDLLNVRVRELGEEYVLHYIKHNHTMGGDHCDLYMEKVAYLQRSDGDHLLLTVHVSGKLAMYRFRERKWSVIDDQESLYDDVLVFDGRFYAVDNTGRTISIERVGLSNVVTAVAKPVSGGDKKCLVSLGKDLMLVDRFMSVPIEVGGESGVVVVDGVDDLIEDIENSMMGDEATRFKVYKLDEREGNWIELKSLGDHVLFLGDNCAFSSSASKLLCSKGNCICFNFSENSVPLVVEKGNASRCHYNIGLFNLEDENIERLDNVPAYSKLFWPPPYWIDSAS